jgi:hypothetical protein
LTTSVLRSLDYLEAAERLRLGDDDRGWLESRFFTPADIAVGSYTNGPHCGGALCFSGAPKAVIVIDDEFVETVVHGTYEGGG